MLILRSHWGSKRFFLINLFHGLLFLRQRINRGLKHCLPYNEVSMWLKAFQMSCVELLRMDNFQFPELSFFFYGSNNSIQRWKVHLFDFVRKHLTTDLLVSLSLLTALAGAAKTNRLCVTRRLNRDEARGKHRGNTSDGRRYHATSRYKRCLGLCA